MKKQWWMFAVMLGFLVCLLPLSAQQKEEAAAAPKTLRSYKVDYTLVEMQDGKRINARNYSVMMQEDDRGNFEQASVRVGTRVPVNIGGKDGQPSLQYMDVGLNIDCRLKPRAGDKVTVESTVDVTNFVSDDQMRSGAPVVRSNRSRMTSLVPLGKKTVIASYDDINSTRSTAIEVLVTQL